MPQGAPAAECVVTARSCASNVRDTLLRIADFRRLNGAVPGPAAESTPPNEEGPTDTAEVPCTAAVLNGGDEPCPMSEELLVHLVDLRVALAAVAAQAEASREHLERVFRRPRMGGTSL